MELAIRNIKRNKLDYIIYLSAISLAISNLYFFCSIIFGKTVSGFIDEFDGVNGIFYGSGLLMLLVISIFIWYSNKFFIRKRQKEIGIYSLVGMDNSKISNMIFGEMMFVGLIAMFFGSILGVVFSSGFTKIYFNMLNIKNTTSIGGFDLKALIISNILFFIFYTIVSLNSSSIIDKFKLIDLFNADNKREKEFKKPIIKGLSAVTIIVIGYLSFPFSIGTLGLSIVITLFLVVKGTYKLCNTKVIDKIIEKKEKTGYRDGEDLIVNSNLLFKIRSNSRNIATTAVLIASSMTALGVCLALYYTDDVGVSNSVITTILFVGICISLVFTICTISIMLFKFIREAYDDKSRYEMLSKIGFSKENIKSIITKQLKVNYLLPFCIGIVHSLVALSIVILGLQEKFITVIGGMYLGYFIVYFIYFLITRFIYIRIIFK